jgi:hypothetical protein
VGGEDCLLPLLRASVTAFCFVRNLVKLAHVSCMQVETLGPSALIFKQLEGLVPVGEGRERCV